MEEVKSTQANKILKTGHKKSSKFMIFDKQKSSDIKFNGNKNLEIYSKSKGEYLKFMSCSCYLDLTEN